MKKQKTNTQKLTLLKNKIANVNELENIKGGIEGDGENPGKSNRTNPYDPMEPLRQN